MQNSVPYVSFSPTLLVYLKDKDPYAELALNDKSYYEKNGICEPDYKTRYCMSITAAGKDEGAKQREYFHSLLDTGYNYVRMKEAKKVLMIMNMVLLLVKIFRMR